MDIEERKKEFRASFKSMDTEEFLDIYLNRPIGYAWALFFKKLGVHPNVVTILSIILGVAAAVCFCFPGLKFAIAGVILLMWANHYDSADGQLARLTGKTTLIGRLLDGLAGEIWFFCIYVAISIRLMNQPMPFGIGGGMHWGLIIWALVIFSGVCCHSWQSGLADYYRNIHLFFLRGEDQSELDNTPQLKAEYKTLTLRKNFIRKVFLFFYINYTHRQEQLTPCFQKFYAMVKEKYMPNIPQELRQEFREGSLPLMKYANILTFNTRAIVLYVSMLVEVPWLYVVFEIFFMTALFLYMRHRHETMCARLYDKYVVSDEKQV